MPDDGRPPNEPARLPGQEVPAPGRVPWASRPELTRGEDVVDVATWAGSVPASGGVAPRLRFGGLVARPVELSLEDLGGLPAHERITQHFCIQGWSGVAKWGGVSMATILDLVAPDPPARWVIFYSLGEGADGGTYYDAHRIEHMRGKLTMLAFDMNDEHLSFGHGAPLRLRNEIEIGFKQVKRIDRIEFVADFSDIGGGYGGYNQDHEFFGHRQSL